MARQAAEKKRIVEDEAKALREKRSATEKKYQAVALARSWEAKELFLKQAAKRKAKEDMEKVRAQKEEGERVQILLFQEEGAALRRGR